MLIVPRFRNSQKTPLQDSVPLKTPYSVHIDPCSLCNFKCKFCFQHDEKAIKLKGLKRGFMEMSLFEKIADELPLFPDRIRKVKIGLHGEPTLHKELPDMISYLKSKDCVDVIEMFTNGYLLTKDLSRNLIGVGLDRINISIEALDSKGYKEITGSKVYMGRLLERLEYLYSIKGNCIIHIKITGEKDKERFYSMFGDMADEVFVENIVPQWADIERGELKGKGMFGQDIKKWKEVCPFIFMYLHYNYDGVVSPCTLDWAREVVIGDALKETAQEIWNGEKLRNLQISQLEGKRNLIPYCDKCLAPMLCVEDDLDPYKDKIRGML